MGGGGILTHNSIECRSHGAAGTALRGFGVPLTVRRNPDGVPWYVLLLILYCLYRLLRKLVAKALLSDECILAVSRREELPSWIPAGDSCRFPAELNIVNASSFFVVDSSLFAILCSVPLAL